VSVGNCIIRTVPAVPTGRFTLRTSYFYCVSTANHQPILNSMTKLSRSNGSRSKSTIFIVTAALCGAASLIFSHHVIGTRSTNGTTDESALDLLADLLTVPAVEKKGVTVSLAVPVVEHQEYVPSSSEKYIVEHAVELGYASEKNPAGCLIWKDPKATNAEMHKSLNSYSTDIDSHTAAIKNFKPIPDLLKSIVKTGNHDVCATARPHPDGLKALFPSNQLSLTDSGYVEPLTPPMRNNKVCDPGGFKHLMSLDYLVHDFEHMCRKLKPTSKRVLIDMGASLSFHGADQPIVTLLELYEKFGFEFDHIYGFEMKFTKPEQVFGELLPEKYLPIYHWINVGESVESSRLLRAQL
jgi:hypothetical protein